MGNFFEHLERKNPKFFWGLIIIIRLTTVFTPINDNSFIHNPNSIYTEETILKLRAGSNSGKEIVTIRTSLGKKIKINIKTHRQLEKYFPDWKERIDYQKDRERVYQSAMRKRRESARLRLKEDFALTKDEKDAIDYFSGRGFYAPHQDPSVPPNIFDTRESFIIKMQNPEMQLKFLKSFVRTL